jgi:hypothetical protein
MWYLIGILIIFVLSFIAAIISYWEDGDVGEFMNINFKIETKVEINY